MRPAPMTPTFTTISGAAYAARRTVFTGSLLIGARSAVAPIASASTSLAAMMLSLFNVLRIALLQCRYDALC